MKKTILIFVLMLIPLVSGVVGSLDMGPGTVLTPKYSNVSYITPAFTCDYITIGDYCVNITGGIYAGNYCTLSNVTMNMTISINVTTGNATTIVNVIDFESYPLPGVKLEQYTNSSIPMIYYSDAFGKITVSYDPAINNTWVFSKARFNTETFNNFTVFYPEYTVKMTDGLKMSELIFIGIMLLFACFTAFTGLFVSRSFGMAFALRLITGALFFILAAFVFQVSALFMSIMIIFGLLMTVSAGFAFVGY